MKDLAFKQILKNVKKTLLLTATKQFRPIFCIEEFIFILKNT